MAGRTIAATNEVLTMTSQLAANSRNPTSPRTPIFLTWYRYMPVMPTRARAGIRIFKELRIAHSAGWTSATVNLGVVELDGDEDGAGGDGGDVRRSGQGA